ncbi:MAG: UMP kinase [bacterium]|nr:UMP kinase [bacterium]
MTKNKKTQTYVLSVGGSLIVPEEVDVEFLKKFRALILKKVENGDRFFIVCGGGIIAKNYIEAAKKTREMSDDELDWIGIYGTRINAEFMRVLFGNLAYEKVIIDPTKKISSKKPIVIGAGYKPGWSSDYDAVMIAKVAGAKTVINLSNIDYAYTDDPRKNPEAKPIKNISWKDFRKIVGDVWKPRMNKPFDPIASKLAEKGKIKVIIMNGRNTENFENCLEGKEFMGTVID